MDIRSIIRDQERNLYRRTRFTLMLWEFYPECTSVIKYNLFLSSSTGTSKFSSSKNYNIIISCTLLCFISFITVHTVELNIHEISVNHRLAAFISATISTFFLGLNHHFHFMMAITTIIPHMYDASHIKQALLAWKMEIELKNNNLSFPLLFSHVSDKLKFQCKRNIY